MRRTGSGASAASASRAESGGSGAPGGVQGAGGRKESRGVSGVSRSPETEKRRDRDKPRGKGKEKAIDPLVRVPPVDVPPVSAPAVQAPTVQEERSPSFELIEPTLRTTVSHPKHPPRVPLTRQFNQSTTPVPSTSTAHRHPIPEQQPSAPYSRAIPPKVKLKTALQPVIHDLSQKKRLQAVCSYSRFGLGFGSLIFVWVELGWTAEECGTIRWWLECSIFVCRCDIFKVKTRGNACRCVGTNNRSYPKIDVVRRNIGSGSTISDNACSCVERGGSFGGRCAT